jgi:hypothetical protein
MFKSFAVRMFAVLVFIALVPVLGITWGNEGHQAINRVAAQKLPADTPAFLKNAADHLAYLGPEPDRWREKLEPQLKYSQEPDHFMDMELTDWMGKLPPDRYLFVRAVYDHRAADPKNATPEMLPEKIGFLPYQTLEVYGRLKVAFREYRKAQKEGRSTADAEADVIYYAGWLGHYVADGSNPLHTTVQYNGWTGPNPNKYDTGKTIHWRMEGPFVGRNMAKLDFASLVNAPTRLSDPFADFIAYLHESQKNVETVYQLDLKCGFDGEGTPESREFLRQRLAAGAQMLANMWYTAWIESAIEPEPYKGSGDRATPRQCEQTVTK